MKTLPSTWTNEAPESKALYMQKTQAHLLQSLTTDSARFYENHKLITMTMIMIMIMMIMTIMIMIMIRMIMMMMMMMMTIMMIIVMMTTKLMKLF